jgi:hypothetical protein
MRPSPEIPSGAFAPSETQQVDRGTLTSVCAGAPVDSLQGTALSSSQPTAPFMPTPRKRLDDSYWDADEARARPWLADGIFPDVFDVERAAKEQEWAFDYFERAYDPHGATIDGASSQSSYSCP